MEIAELLEKLDPARIGVTIKLNELPKGLISNSEAVIDVEHDENGGFVCIGCLFPPSDTVYCFTDVDLVPRLGLSSAKIIGHNVVTDCELLEQWGIQVGSIYWDTMLIGHILDSSLKDYGLKGMAKRELNLEYPSYDDIVGKRTKKQMSPRRTLDQWPIELVSKYNAFDVLATAKIAERQMKSVQPVWLL